MTSMTKTKISTHQLVFAGLCVALTAICSWISIPAPVPFTLQTFAVFFTIGVLGGKAGTLSIIAYILLGAAGVPVFTGFAGGVGVLMGNTGGYILGFLITGLTMWAFENFFGKSSKVFLISAVVGLFFCYLFGTLWFLFLYTRNTGTVSFLTVLGWCVFPFILPDFIKIGLALTISRRVSGAVNRTSF